MLGRKPTLCSLIKAAAECPTTRETRTMDGG